MPLEYSVVYLPVTELARNPSNARTHSPRQTQQLMSAIQEFGHISPLLINEQKQIIAGHGRLEAATRMGIDKVPTITVPGLSASQQRALMLADNKIAMNAGWDLGLLKVELDALSAIDLSFDVSVTGFSTPEIDAIIGEPEVASDTDDRVEAIDRSIPALTQLGDIWWLGDHRVVCGTALEEDAYAAVLGDEVAQQVLTDPPYNVRVEDISGLGAKTHAEFAMASGEMSRQEFTDFLSRSFQQIGNHSADGAIVLAFMDWRHLGEILQAGATAEFELKNICVWVKTNAGMGSLYRSQHELALVFKSGTAPHINNIELGKHGRYRTNVWEYAGSNTFKRGRSKDLETNPTVKPIAMIVDAIKDCSSRGGIILDPFGGSGTTLLAAERTGRRARLIEIDPYYVDATVRRFEAMANKPAVLAATGEKFAAVAARRVQEIVPMPGSTAPATPRRRAKNAARDVRS